MNGQPVQTFLCVRIAIDDDGARVRDGMQEIGGKYAEKRSHIPQTTDNLHCVHCEKSVVIFRGQCTRTHLSYSKYIRQVIESGNAFLNFNSNLIFPLSGREVKFRRTLVRCYIEVQDKVSGYVHILCYLESRFRVVNVISLEERSKPHDGCLFLPHVQIQASSRNMFTFHVPCKIIEIIMLESEGVCIH